jgi:hypothetical protein
LKALGLSIEEVLLLKQNDPRKQVLAWLIKDNSTISDAWITQRLAMGHRSNIGRAMRQYRNPSTDELRRKKLLLLKCTD